MSELPEFVYRIASRDEWFVARETGVVPTRDIDKRDGYMHLSQKSQVLETADLHFAGDKNLLALEVPLAEISHDVKFERALKRGEDFPHLYGALRAEHVSRAFLLEEGADGFSFGATL